jgi:hypothetical protein|nr:zinc ribbon domain-containing protein [Candidatus Acidoferrales bacterium]
MNTFNEQFPGSSGTSMTTAPRGFWGNLGLIRPTAWVIALVMFFGMQALFWLAIWPHTHPDELEKLSDVGKICLPILSGAFIAVYVLLIGFVYVDAKRRGMRYVMWTWLTVFVPYSIGIILYFVLRDPMPTPCPKCNKLSAASFTFCPSCGAELMRTCRVCHKKLGVGWVNCAYCGSSLTAQSQSSAPTASA